MLTTDGIFNQKSFYDLEGTFILYTWMVYRLDNATGSFAQHWISNFAWSKRWHFGQKLLYNCFKQPWPQTFPLIYLIVPQAILADHPGDCEQDMWNRLQQSETAEETDLVRLRATTQSQPASESSSCKKVKLAVRRSELGAMLSLLQTLATKGNQDPTASL